MPILNKQWVIIQQETSHSFVILFGKKNLFLIEAHLPSLKWKDEQLGESGTGKTIVKHLATIPKHRLLKNGIGEKHNKCRVKLKRGKIAPSPYFKDHFVVMGARITFE